MNKKVVVAMSGGVDSSVAAYLLKKQNYNIVGATMLLNDDEKTKEAITDSEKVCQKLGIEHYVFDLRKEFKNIVINNFITTYQEGLTPNPCVICNKFFKFGIFYEKAKELGADYIATGHYAKIENNMLKQSTNLEKDQSYFLYGINKEILKHIIFPLENYTSKDEIREIAKTADLSVDKKKDSQEVCFIPNDDYKTFLTANTLEKPIPGQICLKDGTILGQHKGLMYYTIGQRKGLNISYKEPLYVIQINKQENKLIVGPNDQLYNDTLIAKDINILVEKLDGEVYAKVRSRSAASPVKVTIKNNSLIVKFAEKQRAITKGQSVVLYNKEGFCLGGGIIEEIF